MAKETPPDLSAQVAEVTNFIASADPTIDELKARIAALEATNQQKDAALVETKGQLAQFDRTRSMSEKEQQLTREKIAAGLDVAMAMEAARNQCRQDEYDANPANSTAARILAENISARAKK